jgi:pyridoxamine 5'-phosphate oxidase
MSIPTYDDPIALFDAWYAEARESDLNEPSAVAAATVDSEGRPSVRMVLMKGHDAAGFVFYTNSESRKGRELISGGEAALLFYWMTLNRQVRIEGAADRVSDAEADAYFASRPRDAQIGAWASKQSAPLEGRFQLEKRIAKYALKFNVGQVPRPPHWTGFRVAPRRIEFWRHSDARLHHRLVYERAGEGWATHRLFP